MKDSTGSKRPIATTMAHGMRFYADPSYVSDSFLGNYAGSRPVKSASPAAQLRETYARLSAKCVYLWAVINSNSI
jgi:hypothetical protein